MVGLRGSPEQTKTDSRLRFGKRLSSSKVMEVDRLTKPVMSNFQAWESTSGTPMELSSSKLSSPVNLSLNCAGETPPMHMRLLIIGGLGAMRFMSQFLFGAAVTP